MDKLTKMGFDELTTKNIRNVVHEFANEINADESEIIDHLHSVIEMVKGMGIDVTRESKMINETGYVLKKMSGKFLNFSQEFFEGETIYEVDLVMDAGFLSCYEDALETQKYASSKGVDAEIVEVTMTYRTN